MKTKKEPMNHIMTEKKVKPLTNTKIKDPISVSKDKPIKIMKPASLKTTKEIASVPEVVNTTIQENNNDPPLVIKSGTTDLRRSEIALTNLVTKYMGKDPLKGDMFAFTNKPGTRIKVIRHRGDSINMFKKTSSTEIKPDWPEYQPMDKPGHTVTLLGEDKVKFLKEIGCPENL